VGFGTILASVTTCTGKCRLVRGIFVGDPAGDPDLWEFCGDAAAREAVDLEGARRVRNGWMTIAISRARNVLANRDWPLNSPRGSARRSSP
jgi:hypothetical protein